MKRFWIAALWCLLGGLVQAEESAEDKVRREQIKQQRHAAQQALADREAECRTKFAVTPCIDKARDEGRAEIRRLREQELALDDVQRRERAEEHERRLTEKAQAADARAQAAASSPRQAKAPKSKTPPTPHAKPKSAAGPTAADRRTQEQKKREQFDARQREISEHKAAVEKRNEEKAKHRTAQPLPWPPSASAP